VSLKSLDPALLRQVAALLGDDTLSQQQTEQRVLELVGDPDLAQRAQEWIREAFGWVLIAHLEELTPPDTFHVRNHDGEWKEFPMQVEPIFAVAKGVAVKMLVDGEREAFQALATRSALFDGVNKMLNAGVDLAGAVVSGPAFVALRAELYAPHVQTQPAK
jgi:hypothetical protein